MDPTQVPAETAIAYGDKPTGRSIGRWFTCGGLFVALAATAFSMKFPGFCEACQQASAIVTTIDLRYVGVAFYAIFGVTILVTGLSRPVLACLGFAAGAHVILLVVLYRHGLFCVTCMVAALGVFTACIAAMLARRRRIVLITAMGLVGALAAAGLFLAERELRKNRTVALLKSALQDAATADYEKAGGLPIVVYERAGCIICEDFHQNDIPALQHRFGKAVTFHYRAARPGLPTPTVIILSSPARILAYRPSRSELEETIAEILNSPVR